MTPQSNNTEKSNYKSAHDPRIGANDGISDNTLNITLFILTATLLVLSLTTTAIAQYSMDPVLEEMTQAALIEMNENNHADALEKLITVQAHAPSASIDHLLGVCYLYLGNPVAAEIHLESATENLVAENETWNPFSEKAPIHALNYLGKVYFDQGNFAYAIEYFSRCTF